jgi:type IV pilus assembly protein PilV
MIGQSGRGGGAGQGFSLIEVLVALVVTTLGLLGLAALQAKLQLSEIDSYQRAQALLLVQDMADRIATNRKNAAAYVTASSSALGTGDAQPADCSTMAMPTAQILDFCEWSNTLKGAAEQSSGNAVGAMVGARGCVHNVGPDTYLVTVVWQGLTPLPMSAAANLACGSGLYGTAAPCAGNVCRRALSTLVQIGTMNQ